MILQLFPDRFLKEDACFGLFRAGHEGEIDLPINIEGDAGKPFHIVHSDPDHLAYLTGLILLQAWTSGIDELGIPPTERRPVLVVTDRPGRFGEAYLRLHLPVAKIKALCVRRRVTLFEKTGSAPDATADKAGYWGSYLTSGDDRTRLHNFFPACQVISADGSPKYLTGRQHLGRGDEAGPAVLITRKSDKGVLRALRDRYRPLLCIFDAQGEAVHDANMHTPTIVYHESIFAPELVRSKAEQFVPYCLPDMRFERFCAEADLRLIEPQEPQSFTINWKRVDGALQALIERMDQHADRVVVEIYSSASRLRNLMLGLPFGIEQYEQALLVSGQPESLWYSWSVTQPLQALESRLPEVAVLGEWEELILQELVGGFHQLSELLKRDSPKREPVLAAIDGSVSESRGVALVVNNQSVANGLRSMIQLPEPLGWGLPLDKVTAITVAEIKTLQDDQDCIIHQIFDPHDTISALARAGARRISLILIRNELRFVVERFLRSRQLFPNHPAHESLLRPIYQQLEQLEPAQAVSRQDRPSMLFSDQDFEMVMRMFDQGPRIAEHGSVLVDETDRPEGSMPTEAEAFLFRLEGQNAVFLDATGRLTYVAADDTITSGLVDALEPGHRLIIVNPDARESIAHRILAARRGEETDREAGQTIKRWQQELSAGIERTKLSHSNVLRRIQDLGSKRISTLVVGQWARGDVLGPLDAEDIRRIGQVSDSAWLIQNWQRVAAALSMLRSGHRLLGRQITRIIQKAAVGDYELVPQDEEFLHQVGITMAELQDAVTLLSIESVSNKAKVVPIDQIGKVITLNQEEGPHSCP